MNSRPDTTNLLWALAQETGKSTAIYSGEEIRIEFTNVAMLALWEKDPGIIGLELAEAVPELKGQPFKPCCRKYGKTGVPSEETIPAETLTGGLLH